MTDEYATLGDCPECDQRLVTDHMVIEYSSNRRPSMTLAMCPNCDRLVRPSAKE
ncbi:MAG: hypothetical protein ABEH65_03185 [Halobacteriales archaeon]